MLLMSDLPKIVIFIAKGRIGKTNDRKSLMNSFSILSNLFPYEKNYTLLILWIDT